MLHEMSLGHNVYFRKLIWTENIHNRDMLAREDLDSKHLKKANTYYEGMNFACGSK